VTITGYYILIKKKDGTFVFETSCNGLDPTIIANLQCDVPMATLTGTNFGLLLGDLVVA
jgi:hypothetical protein